MHIKKNYAYISIFLHQNCYLVTLFSMDFLKFLYRILSLGSLEGLPVHSPLCSAYRNDRFSKLFTPKDVIPGLTLSGWSQNRAGSPSGLRPTDSELKNPEVVQGTSALCLEFYSWILSPWVSAGTSYSEMALGTLLVCSTH